MEKYLYSIIIPHKNIPQLLKRCLDSIPEREDIQVIVIDDKSDEEKVDFINFPGLNRKHTEIYFQKKGKGAGYARNIGLNYAKGKWVLFADSDDFFNLNVLVSLDRHANSDYDIVYFGLNSRFSDSLELCESRGKDINIRLKKANEGSLSDQEFIRYKILYPYTKLIRKNYIDHFDFRFDEVIASNDTMFGVKVGANSQNIGFDTSEIYCATRRNDSLVTSYKYKNLKSRLLVSFDLYDYLKSIGKEKYAQSSLDHLLQIRKTGVVNFGRGFFLVFRNFGYKKTVGMIMNKVKFIIKY